MARRRRQVMDPSSLHLALKTSSRVVYIVTIMSTVLISVTREAAGYTSQQDNFGHQRSVKGQGPVFLETFQEQILDPGPSVSLRCIASGNPLPQVTWLLDGSPVPDNSRLRTGDYVTRDSVVVSYVNITSVTSTDGGLYECTASNEISSIKHSARLKIFGPPHVRSMNNISAVAGESMVIMCPVSGHPIEGIFWQKENQRLPYNHRQKMYPNGTLLITELDRKFDEGKYTCFAVGKEGKTVQSSVHLSVSVRPVIDQFVFPSSLHEGQRFNVLCSVTKGDPPIQIKWFKDGHILGLPSTDSSSLLSANSMDTADLAGINIIHITQYSSTLIFESLRPEHRGNYTCEASNKAGSVTNTGSMIIHVPPKWMLEPKDTSVLKGKTALIDCQADGFPPPSVRWSKTDGLTGDGSLSMTSEFKPILSSSHQRVFQNGSLVIHSAVKSDEAAYLCQVSNSIGSGLSKVITLKVHIAAHFDTKFRAETVRKGQEARLRCDAYGDRPLSISWMKDKAKIDFAKEPRYELLETALKDGAISSEIIIKNSDRRDSSLFTCVTSNEYGTDDTNLQLIMQEPPDPPQEVKVIEADGRSVKVSWSPPFSGNSPITSYLIQYKPEGEKWSGRETSNLTVSGNENSVLIRGLKPISTYHCRVFASNNLGRGDTSDTIHLKTEEEAPGGPPLHIKAIATSSKSVKVSWKSPRKDLQHGIIKGYYVGYKIFGLDSEPFIYKTLEVSPDMSRSSSSDECHLQGLKRFTKYAITVQAFNSKGTGPSSEIIEVQTLQNDPPAPPSLKVSSVTTSSIYLTWSVSGSNPPSTLVTVTDGRSAGPNSDLPSADASSGNPITGFILHQKKPEQPSSSLLEKGSSNGPGLMSSSSSASSLTPSDWEEIRLPGDRTSYSFDRLACGSKYQYYITAFNSVGKSDPSEILSTKTEGISPVAPDKNSLLSVNTTAAVIYLDSWHDGSCPISSFEIQHKPRKSTRSKWDSIRIFPASSPKSKPVVLGDLLPSTIYDLKVIAVNEAGSTEAQYSFTTASLLRASGGNPLVGNEPSSTTSSNVVQFDLTLLLPTTVSLVLVIILIFIARIWLMKKRQLNSQFYGTVYGSQGVYESNKSQNGGSGPDSLCLTGLGPSCTLKKSVNNGCSSNGNETSRLDASGNSNGNYPNPYELTKLNGGNEGHHHHHTNGLADALRPQTTPLKPLQLDGSEPMYATVKRTGRNARDCHLYQYPCTINGTTGLVTIASESCCETDSCLSLNSAQGPSNGTTAFLRLHEPSEHLLRHENGDHVMGEKFTQVCFPMR